MTKRIKNTVEKMTRDEAAKYIAQEITKLVRIVADSAHKLDTMIPIQIRAGEAILLLQKRMDEMEARAAAIKKAVRS